MRGILINGKIYITKGILFVYRKYSAYDCDAINSPQERLLYMLLVSTMNILTNKLISTHVMIT